MCEPIMFGVAANAATGAAATTGLLGASGAFSLGTAMGTLGKVFSIVNMFNQGDDQEDIAQMRADQDRQKAQDALQRGNIEEDTHRRRTSALKGKQKSALAANGVELDSGSASDLTADTAMMGELDALTIRNNAEREAFLYESNARAEIAEGSMKANQSRSKAMGGLLDMGGSVASKWYDNSSALTQQSSSIGGTQGFLSGSAYAGYA